MPLRSALAAFLGLVLAPGDVDAQDITALEIETVANGDGGDFDFNVVIAVGADIFSDVTFTPPDGPSYDLFFDAFDEDGPGYIRHFDGFDTLSALRVQFDLGDYVFEFNGGTSSLRLPYSELEPPGFADIISPMNGGPTSTTPTFVWTVCDTCDTATVLDVVLDDLTTAESILDLQVFPPANGSFTVGSPQLPDPLVVGHLYGLGADVVDRFVMPQGLNGDSFSYRASFRNEGGVELFTVPEPATGALLMLALSGLVAFRGRALF